MIENWLKQFHEAWKDHDIETVLGLFTDDVEYWETPHQELHGKEAVRKEWQAIRSQEDIRITWDIYSSSPNQRYTVVWKLHYKRAGEDHNSSGLYLITLNDTALCNYFYYVGEEKA